MGDICIADAIDWGHSLNRGLVSWWLALPGQQRGVMFRDLCGRNHGTLTNMDPGTDCVGAIGRPGGFGSLDFDGSNDHVTCGDVSAVDFGAGDFSIAAWVKITNLTARQMIVAKDSNTNGRQFAFEFNGPNTADGKIRFGYYVAGVGCYLDTAAAITNSNWHHAWGQRLGNSFEVYIDGKLLSSGTSTGTHGTMSSTAAPLQIAAREYVGFRDFMTGRLDDVRILNRSYSASEVANYYVLSRQGYPGLLNRVRRKVYSFQDGAAVTAYPWHYYQQMMAG